MATQAPNIHQANDMARAIVAGSSVLMQQPLQSLRVNPDNNPTLNFTPRNVGLITGFIVRVSGTILNTAAAALARSNFGAANILRNVTYTDLEGVQRIQTTGYHLAMLNSARQGFAFGGAYAPNLPMNFGNHWTPFAAPATIAAGANAGEVVFTYFVPLAYGANDFRGAVFAGVTNATQNLQLTVNATPCVAAGADQLHAIYTGNAAGGWDGDVTVEVIQVYRDQIPMNGGVPILPLLDLNTIYDIKNTVQGSIVVDQDSPYSYANSRSFLSTMAVFNNGGVYNAGSDVSYWALTSANMTNLFKLTPDICALLARQTFMSDPPPGVYYFDHRSRPVETITFGNMELILNANTVNDGANVIICTEAFQQISQISTASSLSTN